MDESDIVDDRVPLNYSKILSFSLILISKLDPIFKSTFEFRTYYNKNYVSKKTLDSVSRNIIDTIVVIGKN